MKKEGKNPTGLRHEGMPQHQHYPPPAKHHQDKNPKYHEEQLKDVAGFLAAHPPKPVEREPKFFDERNVACYLT
jgi:hypothetical protein